MVLHSRRTFFHNNVISYCNRPFDTVEEMNEKLIENHNKIVSKNDMTVHVGDFTLANKEKAYSIINRLNGHHIFLKGSHDQWLKSHKEVNQIFEKRFGEYFVVACHYCMRVWPRSHYNSILLYGHSHGNLNPIGKSMDIGVDTNDYFPYSLDEILVIMKNKPDNFNLVKRN